jgi:hypothetical protein
LNRGISLIEYNLLKLPRRVTVAGSSTATSTTVTYSYEANGQKLNMVVTGWVSNPGTTSGISHKERFSIGLVYLFLVNAYGVRSDES